MKKTFTLSVLLLLTVAAHSVTYVSGFINANTTWNLAGSPYVVNGNALLSQGYTLTIDPGVIIKFDTSCTLQIDGELIAVGTAANRITFTSNQPSPHAGDWAELHFSDYATDAVFNASGNYLSGCILKYCDVLYGGNSVGYGQVHIESSSPYISQCNIIHSKTTGIYCNGASCRVDTSVVNDCVNYGISFSQIQLNSCGLTIVYDSILNNQGGGIYIADSPGCTTTLKNNYFYGNEGVSCSGGCSNLNMTENYFVNNKTQSATGIVAMNGTNLLIDHNYFINDTTLVSVADLLSLSGSNLSIFQNYFADNLVQSAVLNANGDNMSIKQNSFINNSYNGYGGLVSVVGVVSNDSIACNLFLNNQMKASVYGALYAHLDNPVITNNIFDGNIDSNGVSVATVRCTNSNGVFVFTNNTIRNNSSPSHTCCQFIPYIPTSNPLLFIENNNFTNNTASNVLYILGSNVASTNYNFLRMRNNNFVDPNAQYELYNDIPYGSPDLFTDSNYWGSTNTQHIDSVIYDYFDNSTLSVVYYEPILTSPVVIDTTCPASFVNSVTEFNGVDVSSKAFPNPFSSYTEITVGKELKDASLLLYNVFGQKVREMDAINGTHISLRREALPNGIYLYQITEQGERIGNGKLVAE